MSEPALQVRGARELRAALRRAGQDMADLKDTHRQVAGIVVGRGRTTAPRRTGRLGANVRAGATQTAAIARAGGARVPYAQPIHWGWHRRGIKPQPWLSHAAQATEPEWFGIYAAAIDRILDRIKGV